MGQQVEYFFLLAALLHVCLDLHCDAFHACAVAQSGVDYIHTCTHHWAGQGSQVGRYKSVSCLQAAGCMEFFKYS